MFVELTPVTPVNIFNSSALDDTVDNLFKSDAVDVISIPPRFKVVADILPVTVVSLLIDKDVAPKVSKFVLSV